MKKIFLIILTFISICAYNQSSDIEVDNIWLRDAQENSVPYFDENEHLITDTTLIKIIDDTIFITTLKTDSLIGDGANYFLLKEDTTVLIPGLSQFIDSLAQLRTDLLLKNAARDSVYEYEQDSGLARKTIIADSLRTTANLDTILADSTYSKKIGSQKIISDTGIFNNNVGINTTDPNYPLVINGGTTYNSDVRSISIGGEFDNSSYNYHPFRIYSDLTLGSGKSAATIDIDVSVYAAENAGHNAYVQVRPKYYGPAQLKQMYGFVTIPFINGGTVDSLFDHYVYDFYNSGTVNNRFAYYSRPLSKSGNNWGVYMDGTMPNYFGGNISIGNDPDYNNRSLSINGTSSATLGLKVSTTEIGVFGADPNQIFFQAKNNKKIVFWDDLGNGFQLNDGGNISFGGTTTDYKIEILGTTFIDSTFIVNSDTLINAEDTIVTANNKTSHRIDTTEFKHVVIDSSLKFTPQIDSSSTNTKDTLYIDFSYNSQWYKTKADTIELDISNFSTGKSQSNFFYMYYSDSTVVELLDSTKFSYINATFSQDSAVTDFINIATNPFDGKTIINVTEINNY